jgi:hypothetical protein
LDEFARPANQRIITGVISNAGHQEENQAEAKANPGQAPEPSEKGPHEVAALTSAD